MEGCVTPSAYEHQRMTLGGSLWSSPSHLHVGSGEQIQVVKYAQEMLYSLSHLTDLVVTFLICWP